MAERAELIEELIGAKIRFGDLDPAQKGLPHSRLKRALRTDAEKLGDDELLRACNSYPVED